MLTQSEIEAARKACEAASDGLTRDQLETFDALYLKTFGEDHESSVLHVEAFMVDALRYAPALIAMGLRFRELSTLVPRLLDDREELRSAAEAAVNAHAAYDVGLSTWRTDADDEASKTGEQSVTSAKLDDLYSVNLEANARLARLLGYEVEIGDGRALGQEQVVIVDTETIALRKALRALVAHLKTDEHRYLLDDLTRLAIEVAEKVLE